MNILGISTYHLDKGVCLLKNGRVLCAEQENNLALGTKNNSFPVRSLAHCLEEGKLDIADVDIIAISDKPLARGQRILKTALARAPLGIWSFLQEMSSLIEQQLWVTNLIFRTSGFNGRILFPGRHESLAAAAFFLSPFSEAAFLSMDNGRERTTTTYGVGAFNTLSFLGEQVYPHSLELLFSAFTDYFDFDTCETSKVADPACLGKAKYHRLIRSNLIDLKDDGSFALNMNFFDFRPDLVVNVNMLSELLEIPPEHRKGADRVNQDLACSVLKVIEEVISRTLCHLQRKTGQKKLCLIGERALHCADTKRILYGSGFDDLYVQSANGGAIGAALIAWHEYLGRDQVVEMQDQNY